MKIQHCPKTLKYIEIDEAGTNSQMQAPLPTSPLAQTVEYFFQSTYFLLRSMALFYPKQRVYLYRIQPSNTLPPCLPTVPQLTLILFRRLSTRFPQIRPQKHLHLSLGRCPNLSPSILLIRMTTRTKLGHLAKAMVSHAVTWRCVALNFYIII
jgi:hypothetical protein